MERTEAEIIAKMKEYKDNPDCIISMGDILVFMGIPEGSELAIKTLKEIKEDRETDKFLERKYNEYLRERPASQYITYEHFIQQVAAGKIL